VHGRGLITNDGALWNIATRQRVLSDVSGWAPVNNPGLLLHASRSQGTYQVSELDEALHLNDKARVSCELDMEGSNGLVQFDSMAFVGCRPQPVIVALSNAAAQPLQFGDWTEMAANPLGSLSVLTSFGLSLHEPKTGALRTRLVSDTGHGHGRFVHVVALRFYGGVLELLSSALDQKVTQRRIDLNGRQLRVSSEVKSVSPCEGRDPTLHSDLKYASSRSRYHLLAVCEASTGRVVARLPSHGLKTVLVTGGTEQSFAVDSLSESKLWIPQQNQLLRLEGSDALRWRFGAQRLLAGEVSATRVSVYDVRTARRVAGWPIDDHYSHLLAIDEDNDWALLGDVSVVEIRQLTNGAPFGQVAFGEPVAAAFGPARLVVVSDRQKLWFFRAPKLELLGELLIDGERALFVDTHGGFEATGADAWQQDLGCQRGQQEVAFDVCQRQLHRAGLMRATLFGP
jgi:hypothetical protein